MPPEITQEHIDRHVHRGLKARVRIYLCISVLIVIAIVYRIVAHGSAGFYPVIIFIVGIVIGVFLSKMFKISWDEQAQKVISRIDIYGFLLLAAYIAFEFLGERYIHEQFSGYDAATIVLALAGGAILGRGWGIGRKMLQVLGENI
ncbi:MAG: hypothetical protein JWO73_315 [Candidatus Taylorbacteria bacterium]|nr:hypothetical protein [Candidatus Taylorbacteria bacterium]